MGSPLESGLWGEPTASIDWCERNYVVCSFIAEFWNTLSSFLIAIAGVVGLYLVQREGWEARFSLVNFLVIVTGLGSAAFHGTLHLSSQLLDELPMFWGMLCLIYVFQTMEAVNSSTIRKYHGVNSPQHYSSDSRALAFFLTTFGVLWSLASPWTHYYYPIAWQILFCVLTICALALLFKLNHRYSESGIRRVFVVYIGSLLLAATFWLIDKHLCNQIETLIGHLPWYPYMGSLHGYWHTLMALNCYTGPLYAVGVRAQVLGAPSRISWMFGFLPYLERRVGKLH